MAGYRPGLESGRGSLLEQELVECYKRVLSENGCSLPESPLEQLRMAIIAVFDSWDTARAVAYRSVNRITGLKVGAGGNAAQDARCKNWGKGEVQWRREEMGGQA